MNKKFLRIAFGLMGLCSISAMAQTGWKFDEVNFVGAMGGGANDDWTKGWANFNPDTVDYPATTVTISSDITTNTTWTANNVYYFEKFIKVKNGATLTIEPGTIIRGGGGHGTKGGGTSTQAGALIITRGSKIMAEGTIDKPIIFTSAEEIATRGIGDWAGVMLFGAANQNVPTGGQLANYGGIKTDPVSNKTYAETFFEVFDGTDADLYYGGVNDDDNSGVLKYVRIEFGGWYQIVDKEINGLTFGGVGSGTTIDNVQVSYANDDSFEWFGGTVNAKHLIAFAGVDDDFDTDAGYRGHVQFGIGMRHPLLWDFSSSSGAASRGFEADNNTVTNGVPNIAGVANPTPISASVFSNITLVGPIPNGQTIAWVKGLTAKNKSNVFSQGVRIRTNSSLSLFNSIIAGHPTAFSLDNPAITGLASPWEVSSYTKATSHGGDGTDSLQVQQVYISNSDVKIQKKMSNVPADQPTFAANNWLAGWFTTPAFGNDTTKNHLDDLMLTNPYIFKVFASDVDTAVYAITTPDLRPQAGSPLLAGASFTSNKFEMLTGTTDVTYDLNVVGVYPNPVAVNGTLIIGDKEEAYSIINTQGLVVKTGVASKVAMDGIDKGLYVVKVGKRATKVVVE